VIVTSAPLRVAVVGAGVAGAFFAVELHRRLPESRIEILDRGDQAPGAGVVMQQEFVERIERLHPRLFALGDGDFRTWNRITLRVGGDEITTQGHGTFGFSRRALVTRLREVAADRLGRQATVRDVSTRPAGYDLVVAADGAGSRLRAGLSEQFGTRIDSGGTRFLWLSTPARLPALFILKQVKDGQLIVHAYPHATGESTLVVEAHPDVLAAVGLLDAPLAWIERTLAELLADDLGGAPVRAHTPTWRQFPTIVNDRWCHEGLVLIGDAAHTVHFSSGSGTALAIEDGLSLAGALAEERSVEEATRRYAAERQPLLAAAQSDARSSQSWFEEVSRQRGGGSAAQTAFALRTRREMNTFSWFREHDPRFSAEVVRQLARDAPALTPGAEPLDVPLVVGTLELANRYTAIAPFGESGRPEILLGLGSGATAAPAHRGPIVCADGFLPYAQTHSAPRPSWFAVGHSCALVYGSDPQETLGLAGVLRGVPGLGAVGIYVPEESWLSALDDHEAAADFYAVPQRPGDGRVLRTSFAARVRGLCARPVLLCTAAPSSPEEINTLIAAGRVDLVAAAAFPFDHDHDHDNDRGPAARRPALEALR
jgi:2-polyprenyl-6-methoxyphenol hydroxylase-like FAD-dependent oxidoreductase